MGHTARECTNGGVRSRPDVRQVADKNLPNAGWDLDNVVAHSQGALLVKIGEANDQLSRKSTQVDLIKNDPVMHGRAEFLELLEASDRVERLHVQRIRKLSACKLDLTDTCGTRHVEHVPSHREERRAKAGAREEMLELLGRDPNKWCTFLQHLPISTFLQKKIRFEKSEKFWAPQATKIFLGHFCNKNLKYLYRYSIPASAASRVS